MDTITHAVLGACLGEAIAGRRLGKKALLIGALANNIPDIDVMANLFFDGTSSLLMHRGITHSFFIIALLTPLLAGVFRRIMPAADMSYKRWCWLFGSGMLAHIFIDAFTVYGTGWFEPFNHTRVTFNTLFVADPLFTLPLLLAAIALLLIKNADRRRRWAFAGIAMCALYLTASVVNKIQAIRSVEKSLTANSIVYADYMTTPTALNIFLWYVVVRTPQDKQYVAYYSVFDKPEPVDFEEIDRNDSLLATLADSHEAIDLVRFSKGYYCVNREESVVIFSDMRFGQIAGWSVPHAPFVFNYRLKQSGNAIALQQGRFRSFDPVVLRSLWERIKGR